jgi:DNA-binding response OmpR family regulator
MTLKKAQILLVEDDKSLGFLLKDNLEMENYEVLLVENGEAGINEFIKKAFDICILDVMLPKKDGFQVAEEIRKANLQIPIVFLTAKSLKEDKIKGFKTGGDDYITKPFSIEEFLLRIEVILKRTYRTPSKADEQGLILIGRCLFDFNNLLLKVGGQEEKLTYREGKLLKLLCINKNKLLERDLILKSVWEDEGIFVGRSLDVFISRLRKILKVDPTVQISSVHGIGYKLLVKDVIQ